MENVAETKVDERKILEWAGFTYQQSDMYGAEYTHPEQPKDIRSYIAGCAYSLDFQAKYLLPKLFTWSIGRNWRIEENNDLKVGEIVPDGIKAIVQLTGPFSRRDVASPQQPEKHYCWLFRICSNAYSSKNER